MKKQKLNIMKNSEITKLIAKAGEYVESKTKAKSAGSRDAFIKEASIIYGVKLETLRLILK